MPFFKRYLNIIVFLACWNLPLSLIGTFFDFREATTYLVLIIGLGLDSLIIALNIKRVRFNFVAYLKLHPRQHMAQIAPQYLTEFPNLQFLSNDDKNYLEECDLALTRVSSITNDLIIEGIPTINYLKSSFDQNAKMKFLDKEFPTNIFHAIELKAIFMDYQGFLKAYEIFRDEYMKNYGINAGVETLTNYLKQITK
jgi:hypothetical protein